MSRRQLYQSERNVRRIAEQIVDTQIQRAFLLTSFSGTVFQGTPRMVLITFADPTIGARGTTHRARVRPGTSTPAAAVGSPVTVRVRHGQVEVLSFG